MTEEKLKNKKTLSPLAIHPDDAKDKVFAAILKALIKMGNTPSSPKKLANTIVKHKYATLGGQTPFATVSSRISQHFKRAAEHNPPRPPLLTKHVDQNHSRKINYSLAATEEEEKKLTTKQDHLLSDTSSLSSEEEEEEQSPIVKPTMTNSSTMPRTSNNIQEMNNDDDDIAAAIAITKLSQIPEKEDKDSETEYSDYYEEMLLGDDTNIDTTSRRRSTKKNNDRPLQQSKQSLSENEYWAPFSFEQEEFNSVFLSADSTNSQPLLNIPSPESIPVSEFDNMFNNNNNVNNTNTSPPMDENKNRTTTTRRKSWPNDDCNKLASSFTTGEQLKTGKKERFEIITSTFNHTFKIMKKCIANMECYELESPDDISNTKVLRFINCTSNQHVALKYRYRSGSTASDNNQHDDQVSNLQQGYVNATQLRKAATPVLGEGVFDAEEEKGHGRNVVVIAKGPSEARGAWVPLHRARELVEEFEIESSLGLTKLLRDDPLDEDDTVSVEQEDYSLSSQASIDFSSQLTDSLTTESNNSISENTKLSNVQNETESFFVKFEQEEQEKIPPVKIPQKQPPRKIAPSTKHLSTSEILKSMNIQNLNLSALQQMITAMPNLAQQISPQNLQFAKTLTAYMQSINNNRPIPSSSLSASTVSIPSLSTPINDLKNTLSRIPLLDALLSKDLLNAVSKQQPILPQPVPKPLLFSDSNTTTSASSSSSSPKVTPSPLSTDSIPIVYPTQPTDPPMSITLIDNVAVCTAILRKHSLEEGDGGEEKEYRLMRRLDNGFINGTQLLTAGGIETERERSMILSFEMSRVRMPNKKSLLFGTWIPSRRAQDLAATCSIQHALGAFLDDDIETLFPSPLPVPVTRKVRSNSLSSVNISNHHLAAITLAALKNTTEEPAVNKRDSIDSTSSSLTHPNNTLKTADYHTLQHAPLLGKFADIDGDRRITIIDKPVVAATSTAIQEEDTSNDIDIESDEVTDVKYDSIDEETDTDNDVEEVRREMRKIRDAAIAAMEIGNSMQLDDIFVHSSQPLYPPPQIQDNNHKRHRRHSSGRRHRSKKRKLKKNDGEDNKEDEEEEEEEDEDEEMDDAIKSHFINSQHATPYKSFSYSRKRPAGASGGKWSAASVAGNNKLAPTPIKRSATWSSSMDTPSAKKQRQNIKDVNSLSIKISNTNSTLFTGSSSKKDEVKTKIVVSATPSASAKVLKKKASSAAALITHTVVNEDDEDEDVDIGGSDNDDDLR